MKSYKKYQEQILELWSSAGLQAMLIIADGASQKEMVQSKDLKLRFYGPERMKHSAQTSYNHKRTAALELGIIAPVEGAGQGTYTLTDFGKALIAYAKEKGIDPSTLKSKAELSWKA